MKNKKPIEENDLDELLNGLFLEKNSMETEEHTARFIFDQEYDVEINADKEKELIQKLKDTPKDRGNYWNLLIVIMIAVAGGVGILICNKYVITTSDHSQNKTTRTCQEEQIENKVDLTKRVSTPSLPLSTMEDSAVQLTTRASAKEKIKTVPDSRLTSTDIAVYYPQSGVGSKSLATFFKPTEQDFVFYKKVKNKMLERLLSQDREAYTPVGEGEMQYRGNRLTLYPFTIRNQTVTNLEYKIFLADLLKKGLSEEFKIAVVRNEIWVNYKDNILATTYFFDPKYNDFPVVNISPKAAFLFSDWLEKEVNQFSQQLNPLAEPLKVRLPFDSEWLLTAKQGYIPVPDCNGYNTIYDMKEDIVDINYLRHIAVIKKRSKNKHTVGDDLFLTNRYRMDENQTLQLFEQAFSYTDTTYFNKEELFAKAAHVSEIVLQQETGNTLVIGSCWKNKQEYTSMLKEFEDASASPFVGFRVVIVTSNKSQ